MACPGYKLRAHLPKGLVESGDRRWCHSRFCGHGRTENAHGGDATVLPKDLSSEFNLGRQVWPNLELADVHEKLNLARQSIERPADAGVRVRAYDPEGMEIARPLMPDVAMMPDAYAAVEGADAVVLVTEWDAFRALDLGRIRQLAKRPLLVDLRNIYIPEEVRAAGFTYVSIGRS